MGLYSSNSSSAFLSVNMIMSELSAFSERARDRVRSSSTTPFIVKQRRWRIEYEVVGCMSVQWFVDKDRKEMKMG